MPIDYACGRTELEIHTQIVREWDATNPQFMLYINGELTNHRSVVLPVCDDYKVHVYAYTGMMIDKKLAFSARLISVDEEVERLFYNLSVSAAVLDFTEENFLEYVRTIEILNRALNLIDWRSEETFSRSVKEANDYLELEYYKPFSKSVSGDEPSVTCIGHTHITTDDCHYLAWKNMSDEEGIYFDRMINDRLRGVSRMASLEIILERSSKAYSEKEKDELASRKNGYYVEFIQKLTPSDILPKVVENIDRLKALGIKVAIGSSSKNTPIILKQIGLSNYFDAVSDGNNITKSKPDPEVFIKAADMLGVPYEQCMVVEDADAGIQAGKAAGMKTLAVGNAKGGNYTFRSLAEVNLIDLL